MFIYETENRTEQNFLAAQFFKKRRSYGAESSNFIKTYSITFSAYTVNKKPFFFIP